MSGTGLVTALLSILFPLFSALTKRATLPSLALLLILFLLFSALTERSALLSLALLLNFTTLFLLFF